MNTNTKEFMTKVQNTIVNDFEWNAEKLKNQLEVFNDFTTYQRARRLIEGGTFDCYYSQVANTMAEWFNTTSDGIWAYYHDDADKMWETYIHIMAKNIECLVEGRRVYVK